MRWTLWLCCLPALLAGIAGCTSSRPTSAAAGARRQSGARPDQVVAAPAARQEVMLYVPCGMVIPVRTVMDAFESQNAGVRVRGVFDNSDIIVDRLTKRGEKADLVMSPGHTEMDRLKDAGVLADEEPCELGSFELVAIAPREGSLAIAKPEDLRQCRTIASADPDINSIGASGKEALGSLGLWEALRPKMVLTKHAIDSHTIVASGKADAGIAYRNCPLETNPEKLSKSKVRVAFSFPASSYTRQPCLIARLKASTSEPAARFLQFISSQEGRKLLASKGMTGSLEAPGTGRAQHSGAPAGGRS